MEAQPYRVEVEPHNRITRQESGTQGLDMTDLLIELLGIDRETLFLALVFLMGLFGLLGFMGWLADWLERNVSWGKTERRRYGRFF